MYIVYRSSTDPGGSDDSHGRIIPFVVLALGLLEEEHTSALRRHYLFLRRVESVLRRVENSNVSRIPAEPAQLAKRMGFETGAEFLNVYRHTTKRVRDLYEKLMP